MPIQFDYFYGDEAEQFTFYRIPKILVTSPTFKRVSDSAMILIYINSQCEYGFYAYYK